MSDLRWKMNTIDEILEKIVKKEPALLSVEVEGITYKRHFLPKERLILLGGGNIAQEVAHFAAAVGFTVSVVDERPFLANAVKFPDANEIYCEEFLQAIEHLHIREWDYVAIMTRGHKFDLSCLLKVLQGEMPRYVGLVSSKRRVEGIKGLLKNYGISEERIAQVHMPIGLRIGSLTVPEIGISIVAELITEKRKGVNRYSTDTLLTMTDVDFRVVDFLRKTSGKRMLLMVCEALGSTPVKTGAAMAIDDQGNMAGTIGGGYVEEEILKEARSLVGKGTKKLVTYELDKEVTEMEGMNCGGTMKVLLLDLERE